MLRVAVLIIKIGGRHQDLEGESFYSGSWSAVMTELHAKVEPKTVCVLKRTKTEQVLSNYRL